VFTLSALALFAPLLPLVAQQQATDTEQRAIELASSRFMIDSLKHALHDFAVDPRLYIRSIPRVSPGARAEFYPKVEHASVSSASHSRTHLDSLVRILGASGVLADAGLCTPVIPDLCRYSNHAGLVTFSAAWLRGDSAEIAVSMWGRGSEPAADNKSRIPAPRAFQRIFLLVRSGSIWVVRDYFTITA
jgi:hypothetical protein